MSSRKPEKKISDFERNIERKNANQKIVMNLATKLKSRVWYSTLQRYIMGLERSNIFPGYREGL